MRLLDKLVMQTKETMMPRYFQGNSGININFVTFFLPSYLVHISKYS